MANVVKYNSRIVMKHDTSTNWNKATNFIPLAGEIIVYDDLKKIKVGDGITKVDKLPFQSELYVGETQPTDPGIYLWLDTSVGDTIYVAEGASV
jgi:hypothetical protein